MRSVSWQATQAAWTSSLPGPSGNSWPVCAWANAGSPTATNVAISKRPNDLNMIFSRGTALAAVVVLGSFYLVGLTLY